MASSSSSSFSIFPSATWSNDLDLSRPQLSTYQRRSTELKGVAFHHTPDTPVQGITRPASRGRQLSSVSRPSTPPRSIDGTASARKHQRKRSSAPIFSDLTALSGSSYDTPSGVHDRSSSAKPSLALRIPSGTYSASSVGTYSEPASGLRSTTATSIAETPQTDYSALSSVSGHKSQTSGYPPRSQSLRSGASSVSRATNFSKRLPIIPASPQDYRENRSMFPQYDPTKPLSQQNYYPTQTAIVSATRANISDIPIEQNKSQAIIRKDSAVVLSQGYECLPVSDKDDLLKLWSASTRLGACGGRKTQLPLQHTAGLTPSFSIGSTSSPLFSAKIERPKHKDEATQLSVSKHNPRSSETMLLANLSLPIKSTTKSSYNTNNTHIFPHQAAVDALMAASNSPQAAEIARFDPQAKSRAAETLAREAVDDAHRLYTAELIRTTRGHSTNARAEYALQHSTVGDMPITVMPSMGSGSAYSASPLSRIKVALHHPSATQAAMAAESLVLLSVDFGRNACVIDLPSILGLEAEYMLDTAIAAVLATVAMEQEKISVPEAMVFAAPPTTAVNDKVKKMRKKLLKSEKAAVKDKSNTSRSGFWPLRKTGVTELDERVDEMPPFAKNAVAAVELGVHGAFWLLEKGAKSLEEKSIGRH